MTWHSNIFQLSHLHRVRPILPLLSILTLVIPSAVAAQQGAETSAVINDSGRSVPNVLVTLIEDVKLSARESGFVESLNVNEGAEVVAGSVIVSLDKTLHEIEKTAALGEWELAKLSSENDVDLRYSQKSSDYAKTVYEKTRLANERTGDAFSQLEELKARLDAEREELKVEQARRDLDVAAKETELKQRQFEASDVRLSLREIRTPIDGEVAQILVQVGEWVDAGAPVARVIRLQRMRVKASVDATQFNRNDVDRRVVLNVDGQTPRQYEGVITWISSEVDPTTGRVKLWAEVDNPELSLRAGERGTLMIE